jgi:hypothetical protein
MRVVIAWVSVSVLCAVSGLPAKGDDGGSPPTLQRHLLPLLKARCVKCHGPGKREGKLILATPKGVARGGKNGKLVVPGRPEESLIWARVADEEMPPEDPLSDEEKALIERWIKTGAAGLPVVVAGEPEPSDHWAFAPLQPQEVPPVRDASRVRNRVDRFLQAALEAEGLTLGPEADRATLARRVSLDLTGLPPTPEEVAAFRADPAPDAYERMVERYLASPRYGERWGKYWLDAAGYADSNGYFAADTDRPLAYRYRDYVIRSWNEDRPLDQFLREQLAGDELSGFLRGGPASPETVDLLVASHFLRNAPDGTGESDGNPDELRADRFAVLEGAIEILGSSLFGMTFQCARCHDHKFEPFSQQEYYQLQAILYPAFPVDKWLKPNERMVDAPLPADLEAWQASTKVVDAEIAALKAEFKAREGTGGAGADKAKKEFERALRKLEAKRGESPGRVAWVSDLSAAPPEVHLLRRGNYSDRGPLVEPGVPAVLCDPDNPFEVSPPLKGVTSTGRRLALARWITRPGSRVSALLARVTVNRIWQYHFGTGLVATPENFGYSGAPPSHPELLEELALGLVESGWSAKALHRLIVSSAAYRQSSAPVDSARAVDPDDRLLWRFPIRRLDAEAVRDAMLAASGELDGRIGGRYVPAKGAGAGEIAVDEKADGARRRSVYLQQRRTHLVGLLEVFDAPSLVTNCTRRNATTIPLQSLSLLNSEFVLLRARALARRLEREAGPDADDRVTLAFLLAAGRAPTDPEREAARLFLGAQPGRYPGRADAAERAWADFCQAVLASNAFLYVE